MILKKPLVSLKLFRNEFHKRKTMSARFMKKVPLKYIVFAKISNCSTQQIDR